MRIFISIGVTNYADGDLSDLPGARNDATEMGNAFLKKDLGFYAVDESAILIDPTLDEIRRELKSILLNDKRIDVFTFYFAGHGIYKNGSFFMCVTDTSLKTLSQTALCLTEIFSTINEAAPVQTNIIIDACEAGGLVGDLHSLLKPDILAPSGGPSISLFAAAASNQNAMETERHGLATFELLNIIRGEKNIGTSRPFLSIVEIGEEVSRTLSLSSTMQRPVVWGLNLSGESRFVKNPHGESSERLSDYRITGILPTSNISKMVAPVAERLWQQYLDIKTIVEHREITETIWKATALLDIRSGDVSDFVMGVSQSFPERARETGDIFAQSQVIAVCAAAILPFLDKTPQANESIEVLAKNFIDCVRNSALQLIEHLGSNKYYILSKSGGISDFFFLPLRISTVLGYIGAAKIINSYINYRDDLDVFSELSDFLINNYPNSLISVSDSQSPYLFLYLLADLTPRDPSIREFVFSSMFFDFVYNKGVILSEDIEGEDVLGYLLIKEALQSNKAAEVPDVEGVARPTELLSVLLYFGKKLNMDEFIDPYLIEIDHAALNIYIPDDYIDFSQNSINGGINITAHIGLENKFGVFSVSDFIEIFNSNCKSRLDYLKTSAKNPVKIGSILSSLIFPDRVPWIVGD